MDNQNNFFDKRTLIAVFLVGLLFFGWNGYLTQKYGSAKPTTGVATTPDGKEKNSQNQEAQNTAAEPGNTPAVAAPTNVPAPAPVAVQEKTFHYENKAISFDLTSRGMGFKNLIVKSHTGRGHEPMRLGVSEKHSLYELSLLGQVDPISFDVTQKSDHEFEGVAQVGASQIKRTIRINPETEALENLVTVTNLEPNFPGVVVSIPEKAAKSAGGSLLAPSFEIQEFVLLHSGEEERFIVSLEGEKIEKNFPNVGLLGIGTQYFTNALVDRSEIIPEARIFGGGNEPEIVAQLIYKVPTGRASMELKWVGYSGGKSISTLEKIDKELASVIDLGMFTSIGRVLLKTLKWFYSVCGNWGLAIILLTLLVRILVLPLNVSTFRSTKKMQKLQPVIASLRERYKDDPQAMNREMMNVWKQHKVNPVGGCLPMLLQLPIFFALYQVLGQSIELYQAPFFGWIQDLSLKDPFYVLPALMAVSMYIQQKMTPTTMDPTQAKVMQFLPLIFALMMVSLPAGLTLYIFINTLSGIILQQIFMRDRASAVTRKEAKA